MSGRRFTPEEDDAIRRGRAAGLSATEIGATIGRTRCQVRGRIGWLHLPALPSETIMALRGAECRRANAARAEDAAERWTPEQDAILRDLWFRKARCEEIAQRTGRTIGAVRSRARNIDLGHRPADVVRALHFAAPSSRKRKRSTAASHSWSVSGRERICTKCGAKQFAWDGLVGASIVRSWLCDAPPCRRAA